MQTEKTFVETSTINYFFYSDTMAPKVISLTRLDSISADVSDHFPLQSILLLDVSQYYPAKDCYS